MNGYKTVKDEAFDEYIVKKSRFVGYAKPVTTQEQAAEFINQIKSKHWDATHNVYAYCLRDGQTRRYSDDGEPQGTAGIPALDVLLKEEITEDDIKNQLNDAIMQYKLLQQKENQIPTTYIKDYIGELDNIVKNVGESTMSEILNNNSEYRKLNNELQEIIQYELMMTIKGKLNNNQNAINNIQRQIAIINDAKTKVEDEQRRNLSELNDYVKNYSNITFDEYKKIKKEGKEIKMTKENNI